MADARPTAQRAYPGPASSVPGASATGAAAINERLSLLRAEEVKRRLEAESPALSGRLLARGAGSSDMKVGNGRDDASDALDRRVEFVVLDCGTIGGRRA